MSKFISLIFILFSFFMNAQQIYEGQGYQSDIDEYWKIELEINSSGEYIISYPTIPCKGKWIKVYENGNKLYFKEKIFEGKDLCNDNGIILLKKENAETYLFYCFLSQDGTEPYAHGKLYKK